jgi:hypothetical protein
VVLIRHAYTAAAVAAATASAVLVLVLLLVVVVAFAVLAFSTNRAVTQSPNPPVDFRHNHNLGGATIILVGHRGHEMRRSS